MQFKPYGQDKWFQLKPLSRPDREEKLFLANRGEFSDGYEQAFKKHLQQYACLNKFYSHLNGSRLKEVIKAEPLWFGKYGIDELINAK